MSRTTAQLVLSPTERYDIKALNLEDFLPSAWTGVFTGDGDAVDVETAYERERAGVAAVGDHHPARYVGRV
jgi:hypothetical protein